MISSYDLISNQLNADYVGHASPAAGRTTSFSRISSGPWSLMGFCLNVQYFILFYFLDPWATIATIPVVLVPDILNSNQGCTCPKQSAWVAWGMQNTSQICAHVFYLGCTLQLEGPSNAFSSMMRPWQLFIVAATMFQKACHTHHQYSCRKL